MWLCRACRPESGASSGQSASTNWSAVTVTALSQGEADQHGATPKPAHLDHRTVDHQTQRPEQIDPNGPHEASLTARCQCARGP